MSGRTALAGVATTAVLVAALGNPAVQDAGRDADNPVLVRTFTGFPGWDVDGATADVVWGIVIRLGVFVVVAGLLCAPAGRSRARAPAVLAGWAAVVVAAGSGAAAAYVWVDAVVLDGVGLPGTYVDRLVSAVNAGAAFGLWTGWLVGLAVALATRTAPAEAIDDLEPWAPPAPAGRISDPPLPWWAPPAAPAAPAVASGSSLFPAAGAMPPVVAGIDDDAGAMTTVSGDPHPSDPDATEAVGVDPPAAAARDADRDAGTGNEPAAGAAGGGPAPDPDATGVVAEADPTLHMPRHPD
jgi:hypothetical protein